MNRYNPEKHHRRSIRLSGYDYAQEGLYFITLCVQNRACIFGSITKGTMILNPIGAIAVKEWLHTIHVRNNVVLHEYIIMPNHLHGIIEITKNKGTHEEIAGFKSPSQTVGAIIRGYKIAVIKQIKDYILEQEDKRCEIELQFDPTFTISTIKDLDYKIWQRNYYEHIIKDERAYRNISNYILTNPERWDEDKFYE